MTKLDEAWWAWQALSRTDKARFLTLFKQAHLEEREGRRREASVARHWPTVSSFAALTLTEADFEGRPEAVRSGAEFELPEMTWE